MSQEFFEPNEPLENTFNLTTEELEQIVKAILVGKYSWACVLILHFAGYNPLDFIPYRTYIRLLKNNCLLDRVNRHQLELFGLESAWLRLDGNKRGSN